MKSLVVVLLLLTSHALAVTIPTVPVGNAGNAHDPLTGYGSVAYEYRIGTTEVTNAQYVEFLNAKAKSDPLGLYDTYMGSELDWTRGGISRSGSEGSYSYTVRSNMGNKPVNWVSWFDSIRFVNWLNNGQGNGDTENGAYTIVGGTAIPSNPDSITRNPDAIWFLPSEDEWYKAAYHQPAAHGGDVDDYWLYATRSNTLPTMATDDAVGNISNPGANVANYEQGADWNHPTGSPTTVGSAGPLSDSYYGTADQMGNVWEWNEALIETSRRGVRAGSFGNSAYAMAASNRTRFGNAPYGASVIGIRVATILIPEPSTYALATIGALALLAFRRRT